MKHLLALFLLSSLCTAPAVVAAPYTDDDVLHATFVAFQEPGILTVEDIQHSRELLVSAACQGDLIARLVIASQHQGESFPVVAGFGQKVVGTEKVTE